MCKLEFVFRHTNAFSLEQKKKRNKKKKKPFDVQRDVRVISSNAYDRSLWLYTG
jgi:hypothetical protein